MKPDRVTQESRVPCGHPVTPVTITRELLTPGGKGRLFILWGDSSGEQISDEGPEQWMWVWSGLAAGARVSQVLWPSHSAVCPDTPNMVRTKGSSCQGGTETAPKRHHHKTVAVNFLQTPLVIK